MKLTLPRLTVILAFLLVASSVVFADDPPKTKIIKATDLTTAHGSTAQAADKVKKGSVYIVYLQFKDAATAKENKAHYQLMWGKNTNDPDLDDKSLLFKLTDPLNGIDENKLTMKVLYIKDPKNKPKETVAQYLYELDLDEEKPADPPKPAKIDYIALAKDQKYNIDLTDLVFNSSCCTDDTYPCLGMSVYDFMYKYFEMVPGKPATKKAELSDELASTLKSKMRNRLIYDAKHNEIYWFDKDGHPGILSEQDHKYIAVTAGTPVAFEIINVNPDDYKLSLKDTSVSTNQQTNDMLAKFLSPFNTSANGKGASVTKTDEKPAAPKRIDLVRAGMITIDAALNDFEQKLAYVCDNWNFTTIDYKIAARRKVDAFLVGSLQKPASMSLDQFMRSELEITKDDSTLYKVTTTLYNALPANAYHMEIATRARADRDRIDFTYSILAKDKSPYMDKAKGEVIPVYIVGQFKIDVSTGLYYAYHLHNDLYTLHADSDVTTAKTTKGMRLIDDRKNWGEFGFSSYLHFNYICSPNFAWGGHLGVGLSLDDQVKPRYFTGLSFLFGRESGRIGLNLGVAMGNVDRISSQYTLGGTSPLSAYTLQPASVTSVSYVSQFTVRPVIGISYNLPFLLSKPAQTATAGK